MFVVLNRKEGDQRESGEQKWGDSTVQLASSRPPAGAWDTSAGQGLSSLSDVSRLVRSVAVLPLLNRKGDEKADPC
jgi:hypothetical protein